MKILVLGDFQGKFPKNLKDKISMENFDFIIGVGDYTGGEYWRPYFKYIFKESARGKPLTDMKTSVDFFGKIKVNSFKKRDEQAMKSVLKYLDGIGKPAYLIFGNTDDGWYHYPFSKGKKISKSRKKFLNSLKNIKIMTYSNRKIQDLYLSGFGGYMDLLWYTKQKHESLDVREKRMKRILMSKKKLFDNLKKIKGEEKLFVFHYPPKGVFDIINEKGNSSNGKSAGIEFFREAIEGYTPRLVLCGHMHEYQGIRRIGKSLIVNPGDAGEGKAAIVSIDKNIKVKFIK